MAWQGQGDIRRPSEVRPEGVTMSEKSQENHVRRDAKREGLLLASMCSSVTAAVIGSPVRKLRCRRSPGARE